MSAVGSRFVLRAELEAGTSKLVIVLNDTHLQVMSSDVMTVEAGMKSADFLREYNQRVSKMISGLFERIEDSSH